VVLGEGWKMNFSPKNSSGGQNLGCSLADNTSFAIAGNTPFDAYIF